MRENAGSMILSAARQDMTDEDLVRASRGGDTAATDFLMEKYKGFVRTLTQARFLSGGDRDDLIQEGMIGLYRAIRDYDPEKGASFRTFAALCIVRRMNTAIATSNRDQNRALNTSVPLPTEELEAAWVALCADSPEELYVNRESAEELLERISGALSKKEQTVLRCYLRGMSYQEIASELGCPVKSVDNAIQRIRSKVRKIS